MKKNWIIKLTRVGKKYTIHHGQPASMKSGLKRNNYEEFWALKQVSLTIYPGDQIGIIGSNGAGKSTLLRIIAGITKPTLGWVEVRGKIVSLLNIEAGFHPELTGEENIDINGLLTGMSKDEIKRKKSEIIEFADIGRFIDVPFYTYSDGMKFRLAFSIAAVSDAEIFIMDEVFSLGDGEFQKKTLSTIKAVQQKKNLTTIVSTHVPLYIWEFSSICYQLKQGTLSRLNRKDILNMVKEREESWRDIFSLLREV